MELFFSVSVLNFPTEDAMRADYVVELFAWGRWSSWPKYCKMGVGMVQFGYPFGRHQIEILQSLQSSFNVRFSYHRIHCWVNTRMVAGVHACVSDYLPFYHDHGLFQ